MWWERGYAVSTDLETREDADNKHDSDRAGDGSTASTSDAAGAAFTGSTIFVDAEEHRLGLGITAVAVLLSGSAAGWMAGGLFASVWARPVAVVGVAVAVALVALSYRTRTPSLLQYLVLPLALVTAAAVSFVGTTGAGLGDLPDLVTDAVRAGGLGQPPVPFDAGWRFVLLMMFAVLGAAAATLAFGMNRATVGVFVPVPLLFASALIQPKAGSLVASVVSLMLLVSAIAVAYGAELHRQTATTTRFELRRLGRAGVLLAVMTVSLILLNQAGVLFPEPDRDISTPPKKPAAEALASDRVLFTVRSELPGPWRVGVLDVYKENAFHLPPFDRSRLQVVPSSGTVPSPYRQAGDMSTATFTLDGLRGHQIPNLTNARRLSVDGFEVAYDPRTQLFRLSDRSANAGMSYEVEAPKPPSADELRTAAAPPPALEQFTIAPPAPPEVEDLLTAASTENRWDRLDFVRKALQEKVITARAGQPTDVAPARVVEMIRGGEATPFEITAAEVLLARWAGVPARLGYGYFGGEPRGGALEVGPRQGATWLEAYFEGFGWVPLTDAPARVKETLSTETKQSNPNVVPSDELSLTLYVPVELQGIRQLYDVVRYWLLMILPIVLVIALVWRSYPAGVRAVRRRRRRHWAANHGVAGRIAVAYAELRDAAHDLSIGAARATPLEFLEVVEPDVEHAELAWLVTRALWGDLGRDLRPEDAEAAETMARSVTRRLSKAQPAVTRLLAIGSTASLREPFSWDLPNLWADRTRPEKGLSIRPSPVRAVRAIRPVPALTLLVVVTLIGALTTAIITAFDGPGSDPAAAVAGLPDRLVPDNLANLQFQREPSAEKGFGLVGPSSAVGEGRVFTVRQGSEVMGYLQVVGFEGGIDRDRVDLRREILDELPTGNFEPQRVGSERIFFARYRDQTFRAWFPAGATYFQLFVARQSFSDADRVFAAIIEFQRSGATPSELRPSPQPPDPRRGGDIY